MLAVQLNTADIPHIFSRFRDVVGEKHWLKRVSLINAEIRGHRFLKSYLIEENAIAFGLAGCSNLVCRYGNFPVEATRDRAIYPAISLAAQVLSVIDHSSHQQAKRLIRRIHGAFQNPDEMRAFRFEMMVATHFVRRGYKISWPEMEETGTFDILVENIGNNGLEVECKSVSYNKGRKIHRREAIEFFQLIKSQLTSASRNLKSGVAVVLTVPDRLPTPVVQKKKLIRDVIDALFAAKDITYTEHGNVRISSFDVSALGIKKSEKPPKITRKVMDEITSTQNRETMIIGSQKGGVILFVLQSNQDDMPLQYIFDVLSLSARKQMSKTRPAIFLVGFDSLEAGMLHDIAMQDFDSKRTPTALRREVSKFFMNQLRDHIVGIGFLSSSELIPKIHGEIDSGGTVYIFPRSASSFWHSDFSKLF